MMREISCVQVSLVVMGSWACADMAPSRPAKTTYDLVATRLLVFLLLLREQVLQRHLGVEGHIEEADHHFIPTLFAPRHFLARVRVIGIVRRIVEVRGAFDLGPLGQ